MIIAQRSEVYMVGFVGLNQLEHWPKNKGGSMYHESNESEKQIYQKKNHEIVSIN